MSDEKAPASVIDINDMALDSTEVENDLGADAFAFPPPPPESGNPYRVKLKGDAKKWKQDVDKNGNQYLLAPLEAHIVAPETPNDDKIIFDGGFLSTSPGPSGISRVTGLLKLIYEQRGQGEHPPARAKQQDYARLLQAEFDRETEIGAMLQWQAYCSDDKTKINGEKRFKARQDGSHQGTIECPKCGAELQASARIQKYVLLK